MRQLDTKLTLSQVATKFNFSTIWVEVIIYSTNFDPTWAETYYQTTMTALVLLHEIGHIQQTMNINIDKNFIQRVNEDYEDYMIRTSSMSEEEQTIEYRKISYGKCT